MHIKNRIIKKLGGFTAEEYREIKSRIQKADADKRVQEAEAREEHWKIMAGGYEKSYLRTLSENLKLRNSLNQQQSVSYQYWNLVNRLQKEVIPEYKKQVENLRAELVNAKMQKLDQTMEKVQKKVRGEE